MSDEFYFLRNGMPGQRFLETERMLLRPFDESDVSVYYQLGSDPDVIRYLHLPGGGFKDETEALAVLRSNPLADYHKYGFGRWACVLKSTGAVIGFAGLKYLDELQDADIGYRFLPAYWGVGLATEASRVALADGFRRLGLRRVIGLVEPENGASVRVLKKLGLAFAGMVDYRNLRVAKYVLESGATASP